MLKFNLGPELKPCIGLLSVVFDLVWFAFVGALVARHTAYMFVNVTTYEVLVRPPHVQRRFPKSRGRIWFFAGCGLLRSIRNVVNYWTLNTDDDAADFSAPPMMDSFMASSPPSARENVMSADDGVSEHARGAGSKVGANPNYQLMPSAGVKQMDAIPAYPVETFARSPMTTGDFPAGPLVPPSGVVTPLGPPGGYPGAYSGGVGLAPGNVRRA
eukprot:gnl/TRDRNA2_/TRDRNA2_144805_c0_seq1.p1 gnl/TRDRNA2_/TRDRNA2_144805_c0~~gnl/TRDRNA2_/TRDRNA2_144805_c0_seq1.p1  ORF type:complete len:214 (+),score=30.68 gnl/TRDRNA2_/TRDRNA2_144805_c0_seq1:1-642(+)